MINILSIQCGLAFAPYFLEGAKTFLETGEAASQVIRQAANGFIIRSDEKLLLRHQNREVALDREATAHFYATISRRSDFYDIRRKTDEVVFASVGQSLLLSHPQSELWLDAALIPTLLAAFSGSLKITDEALPEWLNLSGGNGRLLLSDQRSGRWVLLGEDHYEEFERRYKGLKSACEFQRSIKPPTIPLKGLRLPLQSAFKLAETLEEFTETGEFTPFEEVTPGYQLMVMSASEGMKIGDANLLVAVTAKESRKWATIIRAELEKFQAQQFNRDQIRTVLANTEQGLWILQWGDEVLISSEGLKQIKSLHGGDRQTASLVIKRDGGFVLVLEKASGNCVALTDDEFNRIL